MDDDHVCGSITVTLPKAQSFDIIEIREYIQLGQRISGFTVEVYLQSGQWLQVASLTTIGHKRLIRTYPNTASKIRLNITTSYGVRLIHSISCYSAYGDFALGSGFPDGLKEIDFSQIEIDSNWKISGDVITSSTKGATAKYTVKSTMCFISGSMDKNSGSFDVYIDNKFVTTVSTKSGTAEQRVKLFESDELDYKDHELEVVVKEGTVSVHSFYYLANNDAGMFEINSGSTVKRGDDLSFTLKRVGGSKGKASVTFETAPGTAVQGEDYVDTHFSVDFADGETQKTLSVSTIANGKTAELNFYLKIDAPQGDAILGFNTEVLVTIKNSNEIKQTKADTTSSSNKSIYAVIIGGSVLVVVSLILAFVIFSRKNKEETLLDNNDQNLYTEEN